MNDAIRLRAATRDDEVFLLELRKLTMTEHLVRAGEPVDDESHRLRMLANFETARIICCDAQRIGLIKLIRSEDDWRLQQIQILPGYQGRGIGGGVIRAVLAEAREAGVTVSLRVLRRNPAMRLYERLGFQITAESDIDFKMTCKP
ncbi:GNAT family N-acetyltransferase [Paraburkholderia rhizosphaerae]|uniref:Acetyltransferase (GNAT) family protein n=1 Tax=Paraburkholderia rhizosphaerae TaxID=480658 RepID=A0A4R8M3T2_9BURK|nr:GNAT family N-acetyltransferase [Paraburkholderia rhizosphaerae]TDY54773.1 acetyltransferase (GNAT) family protein [Paraburkholderia rhizosphaerae]